MEHKFAINSEVMKEHKLALKTGGTGAICVYCETHNKWIIRFDSDGLALIPGSCLFEDTQNIDYTKSEEE